MYNRFGKKHKIVNRLGLTPIRLRHAKKVVQFGDVLHETILYPVPHRHYVFSIPIMLRIYFKHDRALLTKLCRCAYDSLLIFLQNVIGLQDGAPGAVLAIHTFGDYPEKFHPHIHAIVSEGLFLKTGAFYVMPDVDLEPLEEIFRAKVFNMLKEEGKIDDDIIKKLMDWRHSGFSVHNKARIARDDEKGRVALAQYIIRNTFSLEKLTYNQEAGTVIYRSKMSQGKSKKNFKIYTAEEFIVAITQHIPEKSFQTCTELVEVWCVTIAGIQTNLVGYEKNRAILHQTINHLMKLMKPLR